MGKYSNVGQGYTEPEERSVGSLPIHVRKGGLADKEDRLKSESEEQWRSQALGRGSLAGGGHASLSWS